MEIFSEEEEITLEAGSLSFIEDFVRKIPDLVLENRDASQERLEEDKWKDEVEKKEEEHRNGEHVTFFQRNLEVEKPVLVGERISGARFFYLKG